MGDCGAFSVELEELTCTGDIREWAAGIIAAMQALADHLVACVDNVALPEMSICTLKGDLVGCPLDIEMIDFEGGTYGEGGVGELPTPPTVGEEGLEFRTGIGSMGKFRNSWRSTTITFDTPFPSKCLHVSITVTESTGCISGVNVDGNDYAIMVKRTASNATVWIYREGDAECGVNFTYFAVGQ